MMIEKKVKGKGEAIMGIAMAVIMLASLVAIAPTSEARPTANQIDSGDTVYIGEQGLALDLNSDGIYGDVGVLEGVPGTVTEGVPPLSVSASWTVPDVTEGKYYYDANADGALDAGEFYIFIDHAEITGDVILNTPTQDSIVGKSVPTSAEIVFKLESNFGGEIPGAELKIMLTDPDGASILSLDGQSLRNIDAFGTTMFVMGVAGDPDAAADGASTIAPPYADALDLAGMDTGTYKVKIKTDKADCNLLDIASAEMEFTIRHEELTIEAVEDTVYKGEDMYLTITGNPKTFYYLIVTNVDTTAPPVIRGDVGDVKALDALPPALDGAAYPGPDGIPDTLDDIPNLAAWIRTGIEGVADVKISTTGADERTYTIKVYDTTVVLNPNILGGPTFDTDAIVATSPLTTDDDKVNVEVGELVPRVSISTDKKEYSPGDVMNTSIHLSNPADNTQNLLFEWYLGIPSYDFCVKMVETEINLPADSDQTVTVPIPVGNWGTESFCGFHIASLTNTTTEKVVSVDSATWIYMQGAVSESKTGAEIAKEIIKEIERVELPG